MRGKEEREGASERANWPLFIHGTYCRILQLIFYNNVEHFSLSGFANHN